MRFLLEVFEDLGVGIGRQQFLPKTNDAGAVTHRVVSLIHQQKALVLQRDVRCQDYIIEGYVSVDWPIIINYAGSLRRLLAG